jgi:Bacterial protein of unknown function (DUF937)
MAINFVSLVMDFLTPDMIGRIGNALGIDRNKAQSSVGAAVPALLAGLSGVAKAPGGAEKLVAAARQETGTLGKFADMLGTGGQSAIVERGSQLLTSLLGAREQNALSDAIGRFAGLGQGKSSSLLGMLAPIVMGTVAQHSPLSASGMASLFASQKDNIASALPSGFGNLLRGTGVLDSLGGATRTATEMGSQAARATSSAASAVGSAGQRAAAAAAPASFKWLYWLILAAAIAALLAYFLGRPTEQAIQQGATNAQNLTVGGVDLGKQATDSITNLRTTLSGVTDVPSARAALPKLQDITAQISKTDTTLGSLSADQRKTLAGLVNSAMPAVNQLFDKVLAIPGVGEVLKPTIETLKAKLATLTA